MKFKIAKDSLTRNLHDALRRAGYVGLQNKKNGQLSFVRRLSSSQFYPRFHLYLTADAKSYEFNLHLDQKQASYPGQTAHSGEYHEQILTTEILRIKGLMVS